MTRLRPSLESLGWQVGGGTRVSLTPGVRQKHFLSPLASLFVGYRWHRTRWNALDMDTHTRAINTCTLTVPRDHSSHLTYPTAQPVKHNTSFSLFLISVGKKSQIICKLTCLYYGAIVCSWFLRVSTVPESWSYWAS